VVHVVGATDLSPNIIPLVDQSIDQSINQSINQSILINQSSPLTLLALILR